MKKKANKAFLIATINMVKQYCIQIVDILLNDTYNKLLSNLNILKEIISAYIPNVEVFIQQDMLKHKIIPSQKLIELFGDKLIIGE